MAYTQEKKDEWFNFIIDEIEKGNSLRKTLETKGSPSSATFYIWLEEKDEMGNKTIEAEEKTKRYAHACELREQKLFDEILEIADKQGEDVIITDEGQVINHNIIKRNQLQIDARKWYLSKLRPEKYGNKLDVTSDNEKINTLPIFGDNPLDNIDNV